MDIGVMPMKGYSTFPKDPGREPHHQIQFSITERILCKHAVSVFYSPSWLSYWFNCQNIKNNMILSNIIYSLMYLIFQIMNNKMIVLLKMTGTEHLVTVPNARVSPNFQIEKDPRMSWFLQRTFPPFYCQKPSEHK